MKVKDITSDKGVATVLTHGGTCLSYDNHNAHQGYGDKEVKSIRVSEDIEGVWLFIEVDDV